MDPLRLVVDVYGSMSHNTNGQGSFHFKANPHRALSVPLVNPIYEKIPTLFTGDNPQVRAIRENTLAALRLLPTVQEFLQKTDEVILFVDSPGGSSVAYENIRWIIDDISDRGGRILSFTGMRAESNAANLVISAPESTIVHPLASTNFLWHLPTLSHELGSLDELAKLEGLDTVEDLLVELTTKQRYQMLLLFQFFGRRTSPSSWEEVRNQMYQSLYTTTEDAYKDHQSILQWSTDFSPSPYKPNGAFTATGQQLHQWGITKSNSSGVEDLAHVFSKETRIPVNIGSLDQPWDAFFSLQKVLQEAHAQGIDANIDWDEDGDRSIVIPSEQWHLQPALQAIWSKTIRTL